MVCPMTADQGWSEHPRRVHRSTREWPVEKNVQRDGESDGQSADFWRARIDGRTINHEDEEKGQHALNDHPLSRVYAFIQQIGSPFGEDVGGDMVGQLGKDVEQKPSRGSRA